TGSAGTRDCIARAYLWISDVTGGVEVDLATAVIEHRLGSGEAEHTEEEIPPGVMTLTDPDRNEKCAKDRVQEWAESET
ncbi:hypothetical protein C6A85_16695, partial [Mycobacterium sp. ITM-2017-0098]